MRGRFSAAVGCGPDGEGHGTAAATAPTEPRAAAEQDVAAELAEKEDIVEETAAEQRKSRGCGACDRENENGVKWSFY